MSLNIIEEILWNIGLDEELEDTEKEELMKDLNQGFGVIGGFNNCEVLEQYYHKNREVIEKFILEWFMKKKKTRKIPLTVK